MNKRLLFKLDTVTLSINQVIFFDFSNAIASFHDYINQIFAKKLDIFIIINLDNILVYIKELG